MHKQCGDRRAFSSDRLASTPFAALTNASDLDESVLVTIRLFGIECIVKRHDFDVASGLLRTVSTTATVTTTTATAAITVTTTTLAATTTAITVTTTTATTAITVTTTTLAATTTAITVTTTTATT
ncbi:MAG: hypothetical protein ACKVIQ_20955, partial [Acidimicrobiales bacterium]